MNKITLTFDGSFEVTEVSVLSKTKNGSIIGKDEKTGKPIYEEVPATIWRTSEGNFNKDLLDKIRVVGDAFEVKTEADVKQAKASLKEYAISHFEGLASTAELRIKSLQANIEEQKVKMDGASKALKRLNEVRI